MKLDLSSYQNLTERVGGEKKGLGEGKVKRKKEEVEKEEKKKLQTNIPHEHKQNF